MKKITVFLFLFLIVFSTNAFAENAHHILKEKVENHYNLNYPEERVVIFNSKSFSNDTIIAAYIHIPEYNEKYPIIKYTAYHVVFYDVQKNKFLQLDEVNDSSAKAFYENYQNDIETSLSLSSKIYVGVFIIFILSFLFYKWSNRKSKRNW